MRVFTALTLTNEVRAAVARYVGCLRVTPPFDGRSIRWVPPDNLHLTLHFLGEVSPRSCETLVTMFPAPLAHPTFQVSLGPAAVYPARGRPRVVWIGLEDDGVQLASVREELRGRLLPLGLDLDERVFHPHVTLGRVKRGGRLPRAAAEEALTACSPERVSWTVDRVALFESRLRTSGAAYYRLAESLLASPTS